MLKLGLLQASSHRYHVVESGARRLTPVDADDLQGQVCGILRHAKMLRSNLTRDQRTALKQLRGVEDEVILQADKGNVTVVMRCDYNGKMEEMLGTGTYGKLRGNHTVVSCPDPTQFTRGEGVWCHKSKSLG